MRKETRNMAKGESKTGNCRFCGQSSIIEGGADMTAPQLEEAGIDQVCDKKAKQIIITIKTSLRARIMQMAKDKIKIVRETSNTDEFTQ